MTYLKLNDTDFSHLVSGLTVKYNSVYNAQSNAAGDTVVDLVNNKRLIEVDFIPTDLIESRLLISYLREFEVKVEYYDPVSNDLVIANCIVPNCNISYYTIRLDSKKLKKFTIKFNEM